MLLLCPLICSFLPPFYGAWYQAIGSRHPTICVALPPQFVFRTSLIVRLLGQLFKFVTVSFLNSTPAICVPYLKYCAPAWARIQMRDPHDLKFNSPLKLCLFAQVPCADLTNFGCAQEREVMPQRSGQELRVIPRCLALPQVSFFR